MKKEVLSLLCCPETNDALSAERECLFTSSTTYPYINSIPWLLKGPENSFIQWSVKIQNHIQLEKKEIQFLQQSKISLKDLSQKSRLERILTARTENLNVLMKTLTSFLIEVPLELEISSQQISSYFRLIFRDWVWNENQEMITYRKFIESNMNNSHQNICFLGSGASGLSYEIARKYPKKQIISLDHNPFLLSIADKIFKGEEVELNDFSFFPTNIANTSAKYKVKVEKLSSDNHQFLFSSFPDLPFKEKSLDVIIAPWFFDILDTDFKESIRHTLKFLKPEGKFLLFGPSNIHKDKLNQQLCSDEINEFLSSLFDKAEFNLENLEYLKNPIESQNRLEQVCFFSGEGHQDKKDKITFTPKVDCIKYDPLFEQYKAMNQTFFHILKHIESDASIEDVSAILISEFDFSPDKSKDYARVFIQKLKNDLKQST